MKTRAVHHTREALRRFFARYPGFDPAAPLPSPFPASPRWTYCADGLATIHDVGVLSEPLFQKAYEHALATGSWGEAKNGADIRFRVYIACWAARQVAHLPGDFVECGVERGGTARAQMHVLDFARSDKKFWLVDTFSGFPEAQKPLVSAGMNPDHYGECHAEVVQTFAPFPNAMVTRGVVPDILPRVEARQVCYLSLDMNCAEPEIAAINYFWPRLVSGGLVLLDDYAYQGYGRQKVAMDAWAREAGVFILTLPTGQGLIVKS